MNLESRKARAKILKRILNALTVEITELKMRGESNIEELDLARKSISNFCEKLWPFSSENVKVRHAHYGSKGHRNHDHNTMRAA